MDGPGNYSDRDQPLTKRDWKKVGILLENMQFALNVEQLVLHCFARLFEEHGELLQLDTLA